MAFKKPLVTPPIQNAAVLPERCPGPWISPPVTPEQAEDPVLPHVDTEMLAEFNKTLVTPLSHNAAVLPECRLVTQISSPGPLVMVAPEFADDSVVNRSPANDEKQSLGDSGDEPLEARFTQNAAILPDYCCPSPGDSYSPGRETLVSVASDTPDLLIHSRSVSEYQQLFHSVVDVLVRRKESINRSKKIKRRLWFQLFRSTAEPDTESCDDLVHTVHKELNSLKFYTKFK